MASCKGATPPRSSRAGRTSAPSPAWCWFRLVCDSSPRSFILPGRVEPFYDAAIDAQVSGYIKEWRKDIGAIVKKGEVLAVIDTPDLDQRIAQARKVVTNAKSAQALADLTSQRWSALTLLRRRLEQASDAKDE